jgi:hypothetical protein
MRKGYFELIMVIIFLVIAILSVPLHYTNGQDRIIHIKSVTNVTGEKTHYLIFAKEGVFENVDRWFIGKFNSSDIQNRLIGKKECKVHTLGYRIPLLSEYPNITKIYWCK